MEPLGSYSIMNAGSKIKDQDQNTANTGAQTEHKNKEKNDTKIVKEEAKLTLVRDKMTSFKKSSRIERQILSTLEILN